MENQPNLVIKHKTGWQLIDFKELAEYRDLFYFLVSRDVKVRYKQTVLGGLWAVIQPFFMMVIFTLFFGNLAKVPSDNIPYPVFNYSALVVWTYFSNSISNSANSIVGSGTLVSKVYFPRLIIPLTPVLAFLLDFAVAFIILIGMMVYYHIYPTIMTLLLPPLLLLTVLTASGVGMVFASMNAKYRDIRYAMPFVVQFWMFASPVVYPTSLLPEKYQWIYALNPMTGVIDGFRSTLLGTTAFPVQSVLISTAISVIVFIAGALYFKQTERDFADVI